MADTWSWTCCNGCGAGGSSDSFIAEEAEKAVHESSCAHGTDD